MKNEKNHDHGRSCSCGDYAAAMEKIGVSRRHVLGGTTALAAASMLGSRAQAAPRVFFGPGGGGMDRDVFVQIFLRGAMDGMTTVVPYQETEYYNNRPNLAIPPPGQTNGATDLDGFFGLAPAAAPLMTPYNDGKLAFVHASGSPDPTRSHFDAFARMEFADPLLPLGTVSDGWLSRYLDQLSGMSMGVLRGVQAGDILPLVLRGAPSTLPIGDLQNFAFPGNPSTAQQRVDKLSAAYTGVKEPVGPTALNTFASIDLISTVDFAGYMPEIGANYPNTPLGTRMRDIAALIKADLGVEVINVDYGSWDLHANMGPINGVMAAMLDELTRSIEAFYIDMQPLINKVTLVCVTEFARRLEENSSAGTDHGRGGVMIAMGGGINGGQVIANWPGLDPGSLDDGDLAVTIDYRDILGEIFVNRMGATDLTQIFPMHAFTTHGITV